MLLGPVRKSKKKCEGPTDEEEANPGPSSSGVPGCTQCKHSEERILLAATTA